MHDKTDVFFYEWRAQIRHEPIHRGASSFRLEVFHIVPVSRIIEKGTVLFEAPTQGGIQIGYCPEMIASLPEEGSDVP